MNSQVRSWSPFISPLDPCPPIRTKYFSVPPQLFMTFQPQTLEQFSPLEALRHGTLWPALYSPYKANMSKTGDCG